MVYFHDAAESLSFLRATQGLNATTSAVSHRITALEDAKPLFDTKANPVAALGAQIGEAFWKEALPHIH
nr:LysR family transcriptional regulator [Ruegeria sp. HKCCA6837]